jgi:formylglycine-generating enzyme required for sulfatase activity
MAKKRNWLRMLAVTLAMGVVLGACPNDIPTTTSVDAGLDLTGKVTAPVKGAAPVTTAIDTEQYTGAVAWQENSGTAVTGNFAAATVYQAVITLTAKSGYTFDGFKGTFSYPGATAVNYANGVVTVTFPATAAEGEDTVVNAGLDLTGKVTAPVRGAAPVTTAIDTEQYTGTVEWKENGGTAMSGNFAAATVYQAAITLTAKSGYTFTGFAGTFSYPGATAVNYADGIVTVTFPATAAEGEDTIVNAGLDLTGEVTAPVRGAAPVTTAIDTEQYTGTVAWKKSDGTAVSGNFAAATVYQAVITLTAKSGYTFTGFKGTFSYTAATAVNYANGLVTITFPATADTVVNAGLDLTGKVTAPAAGAAPVTTAIDTDQYTGTVAWQENGGTAVSGAFAASTVYQAVITLTAKSGYTFTGFTGTFSYPGATTVNYTAGVVTVTFPATGGSFTTEAKYREMVLATPDAYNTVTIIGNAVYDHYGEEPNMLFPEGRTVILSPFKIAKYETTYDLWYEVKQWATSNGYVFANAGLEGGYGNTVGNAPIVKGEPVVSINWRDAIVWCNVYSEMDGKEPVYYTTTSYDTVLRTSTNDTIISDTYTDADGYTYTDADNAVMKPYANGYRLPTEAQWEYAARGGGTPSTTGTFAYDYPYDANFSGPFSYDKLAEYAVYSSSYNKEGYVMPVGTKKANILGLYDMGGNVAEWCWDWYWDQYTWGEARFGTVTDPTGPAEPFVDYSNDRVVRGGSHNDGKDKITVYDRSSHSFPYTTGGSLGFRVVCP